MIPEQQHDGAVAWLDCAGVDHRRPSGGRRPRRRTAGRAIRSAGRAVSTTGRSEVTSGEEGPIRRVLRVLPEEGPIRRPVRPCPLRHPCSFVRSLETLASAPLLLPWGRQRQGTTVGSGPGAHSSGRVAGPIHLDRTEPPHPAPVVVKSGMLFLRKHKISTSCSYLSAHDSWSTAIKGSGR